MFLRPLYIEANKVIQARGPDADVYGFVISFRTPLQHQRCCPDIWLYASCCTVTTCVLSRCGYVVRGTYVWIHDIPAWISQVLEAQHKAQTYPYRVSNKLPLDFSFDGYIYKVFSGMLCNECASYSWGWVVDSYCGAASLNMKMSADLGISVTLTMMQSGSCGCRIRGSSTRHCKMSPLCKITTACSLPTTELAEILTWI